MNRLTSNCPLSFHIWIWSEGLLEVEASGPINNHAAELRVRQQSADEPVSTKHVVPSPLLKWTTLTFKMKWQAIKLSNGHLVKRFWLGDTQTSSNSCGGLQIIHK